MNPSQPIRVVVADDDAIVCSSLQTILNAQPDIAVVGTAANGFEATGLHARLAPDVLLADIQMPGCDGLQAAQTVLARDPGARVVFLTTFADDEYLVRALKLGARGYLVKQDVASIAPALRSVMAGHRVLEGRVLDAQEAAFSGDPAGIGAEPVIDARLAAAPLTERERAVVHLVADGLDNKEIAAALYLSEGTVRNHISALLAKLGLKNRTQLAVWYYRRA